MPDTFTITGRFSNNIFHPKIARKYNGVSHLLLQMS